MNRVQGDYFETLLYKIFVSIDEQTNVAEVGEDDTEPALWAHARVFTDQLICLLPPRQLANVLEIDLDLVKVGACSRPVLLRG